MYEYTVEVWYGHGLRQYWAYQLDTAEEAERFAARWRLDPLCARAVVCHPAE